MELPLLIESLFCVTELHLVVSTWEVVMVGVMIAGYCHTEGDRRAVGSEGGMERRGREGREGREGGRERMGERRRRGGESREKRKNKREGGREEGEEKDRYWCQNPIASHYKPWSMKQ